MSKAGKLYVNRIGNWHEKDGVFYSKPNVIDKPHLVAVYGTLRRGFNNHGLIRDANFLDSGHTVKEYAMICEGIPYVKSNHTEGKNIAVEVYAVSNEQFRDMDRLEGHPTWYTRKEVPITLDNGIVAQAWLYFNDTVDVENKPLYADYSSYRLPPQHHTSIFDSEEDSKEIDSSFDFIWDEQEKMWFSMDNEVYLTDQEYKDITNAQMVLF